MNRRVLPHPGDEAVESTRHCVARRPGRERPDYGIRLEIQGFFNSDLDIKNIDE